MSTPPAMNTPVMKPVELIGSVEDLLALPRTSVVMHRSSIQRNFRNAWTLRIDMDGKRSWVSSSWRAEPTDQELFDGALEPIEVVHHPVEEWGIATLADNYIADEEAIVIHATRVEAQAAIDSAVYGDWSVVQRIEPGKWQPVGRPGWGA